jgi:hypothetical protein
MATDETARGAPGVPNPGPVPQPPAAPLFDFDPGLSPNQFFRNRTVVDMEPDPAGPVRVNPTTQMQPLGPEPFDPTLPSIGHPDGNA